eukprot:862875-Prymnesium_polylepis.1
MALIAVINTRGLATNVQGEIGSTIVALLGAVDISTVDGGITVRTGDTVAVLHKDGSIDFVAIVLAITVPIESGALNMQAAKFLLARMKKMKRCKWPAALFVVNAKGAEKVTDKTTSFCFKSVPIVGSMREILVFQLDDHFADSRGIPMQKKLQLTYGGGVCVQIDQAIKSADLFAGVADALPQPSSESVSPLFARTCTFARDLVSPFHVKSSGTSPLSGHSAGHAELLYRQALFSAKEYIVN